MPTCRRACVCWSCHPAPQDVEHVEGFSLPRNTVRITGRVFLRNSSAACHHLWVVMIWRARVMAVTLRRCSRVAEHVSFLEHDIAEVQAIRTWMG